MPEPDIFDEAFVISFPTIIKADVSSHRRLISFECSNENCDSEGDVISQSALLNAAPGFIARGILDIDHISEIGSRLGIHSPSDWIVGSPLEVMDGGKGKTIVKGELHQSRPGTISKADNVWNGIIANPPVKWRASIYGINVGPDSFIDTRVKKCPEFPKAKRFVVKALNWRSTALTQNPINNEITGYATVVTMKAHIDYLNSIHALPTGGAIKADSDIPQPANNAMLLPRNRLELLAHYALHIAKGKCECAGPDAPLGRSIAAFRSHFAVCCGADEGMADLMGCALMQALKHDRSY